MGLRKALKKITGGLRKAIKSPLGKVLLAGAAMWAGGQIIGRFGQAAGSAAAGGAEAGTTAAKAALEPAAAITPAAPASEAVTAAATAPAKEGIISRAIKGVGGFVEKNPMASSMAFNAISSAMSPDETELLQEQEKIRRQRWQNMEVPNSVGFSPGRGIMNGGMR